jgi:pilus assembly protein CpaF
MALLGKKKNSSKEFEDVNIDRLLEQEIIKGKDKEVLNLGFEQARIFIQETIQDTNRIGRERADKNAKMIVEVMAGNREYKQELIDTVVELIKELNITVDGYDEQKLAYEIYKSSWGLDILEEIYYDPKVNEIRVNGPDQIYVLRELRNEKIEGLAFRDDEHVRSVITKMIMHDQGIQFNKSNPTVESMRKDGTRLTATQSPVTRNCTFALRKHMDHIMTPEEHIAKGSMNKEVWDIIETLVKGRANVLISGGVGSGKTTLLRTMFSIVDQRCRVIVLETDRELKLTEHFPDRDIVEFEEHVESKGGALKDLFKVVLRYSPTIIVVGEFRGGGEATEAIRACMRGHDGSVVTAHFSSCKEAVEGTGRLLIEEGLPITAELAGLYVASAFNVIIQMYGDPVRGAILVERITEIVSKNKEVHYNDLIEWRPDGDDYLIGNWHKVNKPSDRLIERFKKYNVDYSKIA